MSWSAARNQTQARNPHEYWTFLIDEEKIPTKIPTKLRALAFSAPSPLPPSALAVKCTLAPLGGPPQQAKTALDTTCSMCLILSPEGGNGHGPHHENQAHRRPLGYAFREADAHAANARGALSCSSSIHRASTAFPMCNPDQSFRWAKPMLNAPENAPPTFWGDSKRRSRGGVDISPLSTLNRSLQTLSRTTKTHRNMQTCQDRHRRGAEQPRCRCAVEGACGHMEWLRRARTCPGPVVADTASDVAFARLGRKCSP